MTRSPILASPLLHPSPSLRSPRCSTAHELRAHVVVTMGFYSSTFCFELSSREICAIRQTRKPFFYCSPSFCVCVCDFIRSLPPARVLGKAAGVVYAIFSYPMLMEGTSQSQSPDVLCCGCGVLVSLGYFIFPTPLPARRLWHHVP